MATLRTNEVESSYFEWLKEPRSPGFCILCQKPATKTFTYWKIVPNDFPYGRVAERHDMIVSLRHVTEESLTPEEQAELKQIKSAFIADTYAYVLEATKNFKSVPAHFHLHLITLKENM